MERLGVEPIAVTAGDGGHARPEAADHDRRRRIGAQVAARALETIVFAREARAVPGPQPSHHLDRLHDARGPYAIGLDGETEPELLCGVWRLTAAPGAQPEQQPAARHLLECGRHLYQKSQMAIRHVEHERTEHDPPRTPPD